MIDPRIKEDRLNAEAKRAYVVGTVGEESAEGKVGRRREEWKEAIDTVLGKLMPR